MNDKPKWFEKNNFIKKKFDFNIIIIAIYVITSISLFMIEETDALNQVAEFHNTFKHPVLLAPSIPAKSRSNLRVALLAEELKELQQAIDDNDLTEVADALCDLQYVLAGAILEFGLGEKFKELFDEVHRSNMSKACLSLKEATDTISHYKNSANTSAYYKETDGKFLIYRTADDKTLKSAYYSPADIKSILEK